MIANVVLSTALTLLAGHATEEEQPLNVYLFARTVEDPPPESGQEPSEQEKKELKEKKKAREKELKSERKEAEQGRKDLEKKLKKQYGKKQDKWPEEVQEEYRLAEEAEATARFKLDYFNFWGFGKIEQKDLDDSVEDVMENARKKKWISLVDNQDQAHLLVEILDRWTLLDSALATHVLATRISPRQGLRSSRLESIRPKSGMARPVNLRHAYRAEEPFWIFECPVGGRWKIPAACVASTIDAFIKNNRAAFMGEASIQ